MYPIKILNEPLSNLREKIFNYIGERSYIVVISEKVNKLYDLCIPKENKFVLKDGEKEKNFSNYKVAALLEISRDLLHPHI